MKKIITGGSGLIGSSFREGIKVSTKDFNLMSKESTLKWFSIHNPEVVVHTAARVGGIGANMNFPAEFFHENMTMNMNVIDSCKELRIRKLVCFLSTCIFPDKVEYPLTEDKIHLGPPHDSNSAYAYAKRMSEVQIQAYNKQYGTKYFSVIPCNVYGLNDNYNLDQGHVIPMLIHKCYLAKMNNKPFEVWGDGSPLREFIFSQDVSDLVDLLIEHYNGTDPVILSNPKEYSIKQIVNIIVDLLEFKGSIKWLTEKPNGQHRKPSSNKKLLNIIGDFEFTPLSDGLEKTIKYFIENYSTLRK